MGLFGPDPRPAASTNYDPLRQQWTDQVNQGMAGIPGRVAPAIDPAFRNAQLGQMTQLQGIASGQQVGAGELAVNRQVGNALAAQQAGARMARGNVNAGMAARQAARQSGAIGLSGVGMGQQAGMQDAQAAQALMAQLAASGRQGDLGVGQLQQNQMGMNDAAMQAYLQMLNQRDQGYMTNATNRYIADKTGQQPGYAGPALAAAGQIGAALAMPTPVASDERLKTEVSDGDNDIDEMLDALRAKRYRYKDEKHGAGSRVGIMAQDMERSRAGRDVVREMPEGKMLDINAALSAALASSARLNERLRKVEAKAK